MGEHPEAGERGGAEGGGAYKRTFAYPEVVDDLTPEEAENLRRSIAMLPPQAPSGLSRERALAVLAQLVRALERLRAIGRLLG